MDLRIQCLCIDTTDPSRLAGFWEEALGWRRTYDEDDQVALEPPKGSPEDGVAPDPDGNEFDVLRPLTPGELAEA